MAGATISAALSGIERTFADVSGLNLLIVTTGLAVLVGLVLTTHGLFIAAGSPLIGAIADRFGRRGLLFVLDGMRSSLSGQQHDSDPLSGWNIYILI